MLDQHEKLSWTKRKFVIRPHIELTEEEWTKRCELVIDAQKEWLTKLKQGYKGQVAGYDPYTYQLMRINHILVSGRDNG